MRLDRTTTTAKNQQMHSLADALRMTEKSFVLAQVRRALEVHGPEHSGYFWACKSFPCSQIAMHMRCYVEAAQEELHALHMLCHARASAKIVSPEASDDAIEYAANLAIKASAPPDDSNHPVYGLDSPSDAARIFNGKYPGLDFHRKRHRDAQPAIAAMYYLQFCDTGDPKVLLQFARECPIEFECSGWVFSAFGRILLGMPRSSEGEHHARALFRDYWRQVNRPKRTSPTLAQMLVLAVESEERKAFSGRHRRHFQRAVRWLARTHSNRTLARFQQESREVCSCLCRINFSELKDSVQTIQRQQADTSRPIESHVLQEYAGRICGIPSRTLRSWRKRFNLK